MNNKPSENKTCPSYIEVVGLVHFAVHQHTKKPPENTLIVVHTRPQRNSVIPVYLILQGEDLMQWGQLLVILTKTIWVVNNYAIYLATWINLNTSDFINIIMLLEMESQEIFRMSMEMKFCLSRHNQILVSSWSQWSNWARWLIAFCPVLLSAFEVNTSSILMPINNQLCFVAFSSTKCSLNM